MLHALYSPMLTEKYFVEHEIEEYAVNKRVGVCIAVNELVKLFSAYDINFCCFHHTKYPLKMHMK